MTQTRGNIFASLPKDLSQEAFNDLLNHSSIRIERIVSKGHSSPKIGWYDQKENEWVIIMEGAAQLVFEDGRIFDMKKGDYLNIPSSTKHKVTWTDPDVETIWLAVFYK